MAPQRDPRQDRRLARNGGTLVLASAALIGFLGNWEGVSRLVYADRLAKNLPTGCYGVTHWTSARPVIVGDVWSKDDCDAVIEKVATDTQYGVLTCITYPNLRQGAFDAITSLSHNVGISAACGSRAVGLINQGRLAEGCRSIAWTQDGKPNWANASGKFIVGLHNRRKAEADLCLT